MVEIFCFFPEFFSCLHTSAAGAGVCPVVSGWVIPVLSEVVFLKR
jgi:hypothetical protein